VYSMVEECTSPVYIPVIHEIEVWNTILPDAYTNYMKEWKNKIAKLTKHSKGGVVVPFEVRFDPNKGRALYAKEDIKKGTLVWTSSHSHNFHGEKDYLAFLKYLPHNLQCEIMLWTYPIVHTTSKVTIAFDEGNYINDGGPGSRTNNVYSDSTATAIYNIKAGEELMQDYSDFIDLDHEVEWFDQLRERAFGKYSYSLQGAPPTLRAQNKSENVLSGDNSPLHDRRVDDVSPTVGRTMLSIYTLLFIVVIVKSSKGCSKFWSRKYHGH
jgi:hypothetical protein